MAKSDAKGFTEMIEGHQYTTPKVPLMWAKLHEADTQWEEGGEYSVCVHIDEESDEFEALDEIIQTLADEWYGAVEERLGKKKFKRAELPGTKEILDEDEEPTGLREFRFRKPAYVNTKRPAPPIRTFDSVGEVYEGDVGNGSVGQVAFRIKGYYSGQLGAGISLIPIGVKVAKLVAFEQESSEFGDMFEKDDDGFQTTGREETSEEMFGGDGEGEEEEKPRKKRKKNATKKKPKASGKSASSF